MGRRSLRMLLRTIETGSRASAGPLVPPELIVRAQHGAGARALIADDEPGMLGRWQWPATLTPVACDR